MVNVRAHVFASGRVQGVFFRQKTKQLAEDRGITGWVSNLEDGRVEAVFEGEEDAVKVLVDFCRKGPKGAVVTDFVVKWEDFKREFQRFQVA